MWCHPLSDPVKSSNCKLMQEASMFMWHSRPRLCINDWFGPLSRSPCNDSLWTAGALACDSPIAHVASSSHADQVILSRVAGGAEARAFCASRASPELLYPLQTPRLAIHLTPAMLHPEASHANCEVFRHGFREAEGSAPLHRRAIQHCLADWLSDGHSRRLSIPIHVVWRSNKENFKS